MELIAALVSAAIAGMLTQAYLEYRYIREIKREATIARRTGTTPRW